RAASLELLFPDGRPGAQENAGVAIRGLSSRYKSLTPKHSFTVVFRRQYGATKLDFPLFPDTRVHEFNALALRGNVLDSWVNSQVDFNHLVCRLLLEKKKREITQAILYSSICRPRDTAANAIASCPTQL